MSVPSRRPGGEGEYRRYVEYLISNGYTNLKYLHEKILQQQSTPLIDNKSSSIQHQATCTVVEFSQSGAYVNHGLVTEADFNTELVGFSRRLFLLEGLSQEYVEELGQTLRIEPEFFNGHLRATVSEDDDDRSNALTLPSVRAGLQSWTLRYFENINLNQKLRLGRPQIPYFQPLLRRINIRNPDRGAKDQHRSIGVVDRHLSYWQRKYDNGCFDAVALLDPALEQRLYIQDFGPPDLRSSAWTPYGGGFIDFATIRQRRALANSTASTKPPRTASLVHDVIWRMQHLSLFVAAPCTSDNIAFLLQRIVLSHWTLSLAFFQREFYATDLNSLIDDSVSTGHTREILASLESSRALLDRSVYLLRRNLAELGHNTPTPTEQVRSPEPATEHLKLLRVDWQFVKDEIEAFMQDTEGMINMRMLNLTIGDSKRGVEDSMRAEKLTLRSQESADQVNQLTGLGQFLLLIYTPVATAYGVLSMAGEFGPGQDKFWVFWVIAIPLSTLTILIYILWLKILNTLRRQRFTESTTSTSSATQNGSLI